MSVVTEQHIRESKMIAALVEGGMGEAILEVVPAGTDERARYRDASPWAAVLEFGYGNADPTVWRALTLTAMAERQPTACRHCCTQYWGYHDAAEHCTHEVRF